jgi:hypothetical protein
MRWFKHLTQSHEDERLCALRDLMGQEGYGMWWSILERIAANMEGQNPPTSLEFSAKNWAKFLGVSVGKFSKFIEILQKTLLMSVEVSGQSVKLNCPNLLKYKDEYSKKSGHNAQRCPESVRTLSAQSQSQSQSQSQNKKRPPYPPAPQGELLDSKPTPKNNTIPKPKAFDLFWKEYPRHINKAGAMKKWTATLQTQETDPEQLIAAARKYFLICKGKEEKFILHPATFLGPDKRWKDFLDCTPPPTALDGLRAFAAKEQPEPKNITPKEATK